MQGQRGEQVDLELTTSHTQTTVTIKYRTTAPRARTPTTKTVKKKPR